MKNLVLLFTGVLMGLTTVTAETKSASQGEDLVVNPNHFVQPILFVERGVEFLIFPDGSFDFNTQLDYTQGDDYYRKGNSTVNTKRRSVNRTYGAPGTYNTYYYGPVNSGTVVLHDHSGKVRRIGNVFLNYNRQDQIKRVGSVYINYNRQGLVSQIGGMRLVYNPRGKLIRTIGHVNRYNTNFNLQTVSGNHYNEFDDFNYNYNNDDFYYFKNGVKTEKPKLKKVKR